MALEVANIFGRLGLDDSEYRAKLGAAPGEFKKVGSQFTAIGKQIAGAMAVAFAADAVADFVRDSVQAAASFESAFAGVRKTVEATEAQYARLSQAIRDMAKEIPATVEEIAGVAEVAGQLGVGVEDIEAFTRVMIDLGNTTDLTSEQAATAIARFANIMGTSLSEVDKLGAAIVGLGNNFETTESEIVTMAQRLAGAGRQAGLTESEVLALAAAMSSVGIQAQLGGSTMGRILLEMQKAAVAGAESIKGFNRVVGDFATVFREDAAGAVQQFIENFGQLSDTEALAALDEIGVSGDEVNRVILSLANAGDKMGMAFDRAATDIQSNTALVEEAAKRYGTFESQVETFNNQLNDLKITIGRGLIPPLTRLTRATSDWLDVVTSAASGDIDRLGDKLDDLASSFQRIGVLSPAAVAVLDVLAGIMQGQATEVERAQTKWEKLREEYAGTVDVFADLNPALAAFHDVQAAANDETDRGTELTEEQTKALEELADKRAKAHQDFVEQLRKEAEAWDNWAERVEEATDFELRRPVPPSPEAVDRARDWAGFIEEGGFKLRKAFPPATDEISKTEKALGDVADTLVQLEQAGIEIFSDGGTLAASIASMFGAGGTLQVALAAAITIFEAWGFEVEMLFQQLFESIGDQAEGLVNRIGGIFGAGGGTGNAGDAILGSPAMNQAVFDKLFAQWTRDMERLNEQAAIAEEAGQDFDLLGEQIRITQGYINELIALGFKPWHPVMQFFIGLLGVFTQQQQEANEELERGGKAVQGFTDDVTRFIDELETTAFPQAPPDTGPGTLPGGFQTEMDAVLAIVADGFAQIENKADIFRQIGRDFDELGAKQDFLRRLLDDLSDRYGANSEIVQELIRLYNVLTAAQEKQQRVVTDVLREASDAADDAADAIDDVADAAGDAADKVREIVKVISLGGIEIDVAIEKPHLRFGDVTFPDLGVNMNALSQPLEEIAANTARLVDLQQLAIAATLFASPSLTGTLSERLGQFTQAAGILDITINVPAVPVDEVTDKVVYRVQQRFGG